MPVQPLLLEADRKAKQNKGEIGMKELRTRGLPNAKQTVDNGVNLAAASEAILDGESLHFTWRANCEWVNGVYVRSTVDGYTETDESSVRNEKFAVAADYPEMLAGEDKAPTPIELVLSALASCLTGGVAIAAQYRDIQLRYIETMVEGRSDLHRSLAKEPDLRSGNSTIEVSFVIDADATVDELKDLAAEAQKRSVVLELLANPNDVVVEVK